MQDMRVGAAFRAVRVRRRWRQQDVADRAGVSRTLVSDIERGHFGSTPIDTVRKIAATLDIRIDILMRWRGGELPRLLNARHSALHESVAAHLEALPGWVFSPEVSFSIYGERGIIDILAYHPASRALLVIELKTDIVDVNDLVGALDRKARLGARIATERGWDVSTVSRWVIVARDKTNQRRVAAHRAMLRAAFPNDGHSMRRWLSDPCGTVSALSMWTNAASSNASPTRSHRVRVQSGTRRRGRA